MKVCTNKVEKQNIASPEIALRDMAERMIDDERMNKKRSAGENMLYLLVRRKILRLYWLARQM